MSNLIKVVISTLSNAKAATCKADAHCVVATGRRLFFLMEDGASSEQALSIVAREARAGYVRVKGPRSFMSLKRKVK